MGLLDVLVERYREEQAGESQKQFVDNVGNPLSTMSTNLQLIEIERNTQTQKGGGGASGAKKSERAHPKKPKNSKCLPVRTQFVDFVACVREDESSKLTPLSQEKAPTEPLSVGSLARASDIVDKCECSSCPACGHWDGYGPWRMLPGHYCFHSAYFKGKPARPIPVEKASCACPLIVVGDDRPGRG